MAPSKPPYPAIDPRPLAEVDFQQQVITAAQLLGWKVYWTWRSDHSPPGFPDLIMVHVGSRLVRFRELKVGTRKPTPAQADWLAALNAAGADAAVWTPAMWDLIERELGAGGE